MKEHSLSKLNEQWDHTQQLLPYLKTYQIHSATFESGVLENAAVLQRLHELKEQYGISIGLTVTGDHQSEVLKKAFDVVVENEPLFQSLQATFNILDQSILELRDVLEDNGRQLIVKEALANGRLFRNTIYPHYQSVYGQLESIAQRYDVGVDAVALRFCMDAFSNSTVLSGANNANHIASNLKANDFQLDEKEMKALMQFGIAPNAYWSERKKLSWN